MITTLLFDLDNTLLGNDMGVFLPAYFQLLTGHLAGDGEGEQLVTELVQSTRAVFANTDPARNLFTIFNDHFYPALGWEAETWQPRLDEFYRMRYPQLQRVTHARPAARATLEWAFDAGYQVAIATSPVFPLAAIRERLRWAGIDDFPFAHVTALENSHFAKPRPEYLAEILAHLGRRPDEALMVGDDWSNDMVPASALGMPHFWIAPAGSAPPDRAKAHRTHPVGVGDLEAFQAWAASALPHLTLPPAPALALPYLLSGDLAAVVGALEALPEADWAERPTPAEWSLTEIVCHLRDVETEVNMPRLLSVIETDNPFLSGADTDPWAEERNYQCQSGPEALEGFITARKQTITLLSGLPADCWNRPARHSLFGPTHLAEIVGWILDHDRIHIQQLKATRK